MGYEGACTFIFICSGPSATVTNLKTGAKVAEFDLGEGSGQVRSISSGPGLYEISVSPGQIAPAGRSRSTTTTDRLVVLPGIDIRAVIVDLDPV